MFSIEHGGEVAGAEFDEIRIGSEWADVVGAVISEPSSFALAAVGFIAGVTLLRRR